MNPTISTYNLKVVSKLIITTNYIHLLYITNNINTYIYSDIRSVGQMVGGHQHRRPIKPEAKMATQNLTVL